MSCLPKAVIGSNEWYVSAFLTERLREEDGPSSGLQQAHCGFPLLQTRLPPQNPAPKAWSDPAECCSPRDWCVRESGPFRSASKSIFILNICNISVFLGHGWMDGNIDRQTDEYFYWYLFFIVFIFTVLSKSRIFLLSLTCLHVTTSMTTHTCTRTRMHKHARTKDSHGSRTYEFPTEKMKLIL